MTEDDLHKIVAQWLGHALPPGSVFHHSPNEGKRHVAYNTRLKALGMKSGWPDIEIFVRQMYFWDGIGQPIFIELKAPKRGTLSANQKAMQEQLIGCECIVATANKLSKVKALLSHHIQLNDNAKMKWLEQIAQAKGG
jgi:hypothetical protein